MTTLTDASRYTAAELADLYFQRWDVELLFRDIKTTMGMDVLRCRSSAMVEKEILMHFIAYNAIRLLMVEAADEAGKAPRRLSFKASIQALRQWEPQFSRASDPREQRRLLAMLEPRSLAPWFPIGPDGAIRFILYSTVSTDALAGTKVMAA